MRIKLLIVLLTSLFINDLLAQKILLPPPTPASELPPPPPPPPPPPVYEAQESAPSEYDQAEVMANQIPPEDKVYEMFDVQQPPSFPGGDTEMFKFMSANLQYPALAKENAITGVVALTFVIDTTGKISNIQIIKDIGGGCGKESVRLINSMPLWIPGETLGHKVKVRYTMPIRFRLN